MGVGLEASHPSEEGVTLPPTQSILQHCALRLKGAESPSGPWFPLP